MTETRLNLEQIIMQGLQEPQKPDCWCHDEPQMECPTHGSAEFYAHQCHELMVVNYLLANTIREIKLLADDMPLIYTGALIYGASANQYGYMDRWCYHSVQEAIAAGDAWSGDWPNVEPEGWHRHPGTGRRREGGDPSKEEVRM
jgi:hypothetical protein